MPCMTKYMVMYRNTDYPSREWFVTSDDSAGGSAIFNTLEEAARRQSALDRYRRDYIGTYSWAANTAYKVFRVRLSEVTTE